MKPSKLKKRSGGARRRWTPDQKHQILCEQEQSGLSLWEYARQQGLGYSSLTRWQRDARKTAPVKRDSSHGAAVIFQELPNAPRGALEASPEAALRICFSGGTCVEVGSRCQAALLKILLTHWR